MKERGLGYEGYEQEAISDLVSQASRDRQRLLIYQSGRLDHVKFAAYLCFWFRKIKPIWKGIVEATGKRLPDINERIALYMLAEIVYQLDKNHKPEVADARRRNFEDFFNSPRFEYTVKSMRTRTFGPHHIVMLADSLAPHISK